MEDVLKEYQQAEDGCNEAKSGYDSANAQLTQLKKELAEQFPEADTNEIEVL
jgi:hypothetical protein